MNLGKVRVWVAIILAPWGLGAQQPWERETKTFFQETIQEKGIRNAKMFSISLSDTADWRNPNQIFISKSRETHYSFNPGGKVDSTFTQGAAFGFLSINEFDGEGHVIKVVEKDWRVDAVGDSVFQSTQWTQYTYNDRGQITQKRLQHLGLRDEVREAEFTYDGEGRLNRILGVVHRGGDVSSFWIEQFSYSGSQMISRDSSSEQGEYLVEKWDFDERGRLKKKITDTPSGVHYEKTYEWLDDQRVARVSGKGTGVGRDPFYGKFEELYLYDASGNLWRMLRLSGQGDAQLFQYEYH